MTCLIPKKGEGVLMQLESSGQHNVDSKHGEADSSQIVPQPKAIDNLPEPIP